MGRVYTATTEAEEALAAATVETVLQLRGGTASKARLVAWGISFDGVTAGDDPVTVLLRRQSTDGTGSGANEYKFDEDNPTATVTAFHSFTAEPTGSNTLERYLIHPQGGGIVREYPIGREIVIDDVATSRLAITAQAPQAVNVEAWMQWEE